VAINKVKVASQLTVSDAVVMVWLGVEVLVGKLEYEDLVTDLLALGLVLSRGGLGWFHLGRRWRLDVSTIRRRLDGCISLGRWQVGRIDLGITDVWDLAKVDGTHSVSTSG
jgi:hypothetical protein